MKSALGLVDGLKKLIKIKLRKKDEWAESQFREMAKLGGKLVL